MKVFILTSECPGVGGGFDALFAVRLESVVVFDPEQGDHGEFSFSLVNRQVDLINSLAQPEDGRVATLRYICHPDLDYYRRGAVDVAIIGHVHGGTRDEAEDRAQQYFRDLWTVLNSVSEHYDFSPVLEETRLGALLRPFEIQSVVEVSRREDLIEAATAKNVRGFGCDEIPTHVSQSAIHYVYSYIWGVSTMERTLSALLRGSHPSMISVTLKPVCYTEQVSALYEEQIERIEKGMRESRGKHRLEEIQKNFKIQALRIEDSPFLVRSYIASAGPADRALVDSFGVDVTEHSGSPDILQQVRDECRFSGGYSWAIIDDPERKRKVLSELDRAGCSCDDSESESHGVGDIRYLFDPIQAACVFRLPVPLLGELPGIAPRYYKGGAPPNAVGSGQLTLGSTRRDGRVHEIGSLEKDRLQHTYVVGQTGTGKSTLLLNMIVQDICNGEGLCVLDPHGELINEILPRIPESRRDDIIYVNLEDSERPIGLNMLEANGALEKDRVVQLLFEIFEKTYDLRETGGPMFEMYMKLALYTVMSDPNTTPTILDVQRVFIDKSYREYLISQIDDPYLRKSWEQVVEQAGGEAGLKNVVPYITSKLSMFVYNTTIRNIVSQRKSSIDFNEVIEGGKILLVDLCKGRIGPLYSNFLGMVMVNKVLMSVLGRGKTGKLDTLRPFYLYVDEFQNLATDSFTTLLSEARKYRLGAILANQYLAQIPEPVLDSIFGNVGTLISFRVGANDAEILERQYFPAFSQRDLMNIPNWKVLVRMLWKGDKMSPFELETQAPGDGKNEGAVQSIINRSREKYGREPETFRPVKKTTIDEIVVSVVKEDDGFYSAESDSALMGCRAVDEYSLLKKLRKNVTQHFGDPARSK